MTDLFDAPQNTPMIDPSKDYSAELVGEDKKFKSVADLARAKVEADLFIESLKREAAEARAEANTRIKLEEFMTKLDTLERPAPPVPQPHQGEDRGNQEAALKPEDIVARVRAELAQEHQIDLHKRNLNEVKDRLTQKYGDNFPLVMKEKAASLGLGQEFLTDLAKSQPKAFYAIVGLDAPAAQRPQDVQPQSVVNSLTFKPNSGEKTMAYYDDLRVKDRQKYLSRETQLEIHKQMVKLGSAFFT